MHGQSTGCLGSPHPREAGIRHHGMGTGQGAGGGRREIMHRRMEAAPDGIMGWDGQSAVLGTSRIHCASASAPGAEPPTLCIAR